MADARQRIQVIVLKEARNAQRGRLEAAGFIQMPAASPLRFVDE